MQISETISLEPLADHHAEPAFELIDNNRTHLKTWLTWVDFMQSADNFRSFIKGAQQRAADNQEASFMILHARKVAGRIGLYYLDHQNKTGAIGYWLGEEFQGKGLVTEACKEIIGHGFTALGLNRIEIKCATGNHKSQGIPERLGFTREGILRQAEQVNGRFHDLYLYSLLKEEWVK
ncbi:GNAT family N-acetyltransferase [Adhaeribacter soli]|uniref:GNAT family N-acetyltransferase n=1 Tax=Adhaeribacter soli TaxID=2607655 RepID=A0A5N1IPN1_9BACT|nr:GNAT family protein [Adhaeribacter soli]KAA9325987.1 GNAT family N-acetyltransferase [Adhaeribacter soli]